MLFNIGVLTFHVQAVPFGLAERLGTLGMSDALEAMLEPLGERLAEGDPELLTLEYLRDHMTIPDIERVIHVLQFGELHEQYLRPSQLALAAAERGGEGNPNQEG